MALPNPLPLPPSGPPSCRRNPTPNLSGAPEPPDYPKNRSLATLAGLVPTCHHDAAPQVQIHVTPTHLIVLSTNSRHKVPPFAIKRNGNHPGSFYMLDESLLPDSRPSYLAYGLVGILSLAAAPPCYPEPMSYLVITTGLQPVGHLFTHPLYRVRTVEFVPFAWSPRHLPMISSASVSPSQAKTPYAAFKAFIEDGLFYTSPCYPLTSSLQRWSSINPSQRELISAHKLADQRFFWNNFIARAFLKKKLQHLIMILIRGNVSVRNFALPSFALSGVQDSIICTLTLISKISTARAGTRYNVRGADDAGAVAMFVETEQILVANCGHHRTNHVYSYTQVRGSVPVLWDETSIRTAATMPRLSHNANGNMAFKRHLEDLFHRYQRIHIVNLLSSKRRERALSDAFEEQILAPNDFDPDILRYTHFNFNAECAQNYANVSNFWSAGPARQDIRRFGYFHALLPQTMSHAPDLINPASVQSGVFRTNCLDCLDRTNVAQAALGKFVLMQQLKNLVSLSHSVAPVNARAFGVIEPLLNQCWADNADALSKSYTGTGAMKSSFTRRGRHTIAGLIDDGLKSMTRLYINTFRDGETQLVIDTFLGKCVVVPEPHELPLEDAWVRNQLKARASEYIRYDDVVVSVVTYNAAASVPAAAEWLLFDSIVDAAPFEPDQVSLYVIGLQEIVPLNAQQTLWAADQVPIQVWEQLLVERINARAAKRFVLLRSIQLVGTAMIVILPMHLIQHVSQIMVQQVKVGWGGVAGNKGAVAMRMKLFDSDLCFVCAHLTSNQKGFNARIADVSMIQNEIAFDFPGGSGGASSKAVCLAKALDAGASDAPPAAPPPVRSNHITIKDHDYACWFGDLNFRIDKAIEEVFGLLAARSYDKLLESDQLRYAQRVRLALTHFLEGKIEWPPTYKYDPATRRFSTNGPIRTPSYTDRILWAPRVNGLDQEVQILDYQALPIFLRSDHLPVRATTLIRVRLVDQEKYQALKDKLFQTVTAQLNAQATNHRPTSL